MKNTYKNTGNRFSQLIFRLLLLALSLIGTLNAMSCSDKTTKIQVRLVGQWKYDFEQVFEPAINFLDPIVINNAKIKDNNYNNYLILSFEPAVYSGGKSDVSRIFIFNTDDPLSPKLSATIAPQKREKDDFLVRSSVVGNNIIFSGFFSGKGLWMVDISDPNSPQDLGITPGNFGNIASVNGNYAYVWERDNSITIIDVSNIKDIKMKAKISSSSRKFYNFTVGDQILYIGTSDSTSYGVSDTLTIVDISSPESPKILCNYELQVPEGLIKRYHNYPGAQHWDKLAFIFDLQISGKYLYIAFGAGGLRIIDVSNPTVPKEVAKLDVNTFAIRETLKDNLLYLTKTIGRENNKIQLCIIDISQPINPRILDSVQTASDFGLGGGGFAYFGMRPQVIDNHVYIAGMKYMDIIEVR